MAKENNKKLIIWALVALVIGVIIGMLITNFVTTGNATLIGKKSNLISIKDQPHYQCRCNGVDQPYCDFGSDYPENVAGYCAEMCPCKGTQTYVQIK